MTDPYTEIAHQRPNEVRVGGALITMVEPHPGHEHAYNRWYEDDHFFAGAMQGPWTFSGRRFAATRELRDMRVDVANPLVVPPDAGCYLSLYWITAGQELNNERWSFHAMADALIPDGRGFDERTHAYTAFHRHRFSCRRDDGPLRAETALVHPFAGLVMDIIDAPNEDVAGDLATWLSDEAVPQALTGSPIAIAVAFEPVAFSQGRIESSTVPLPDALGRRICLLWFLEGEPRACFPDAFTPHHRALAASGLGELRFSGPFIPTVPGTDRYVSELR